MLDNGDQRSIDARGALPRRAGGGEATIPRARAAVLAWVRRLKTLRPSSFGLPWGSCSSAGIATLASDLVDQDPHLQDFAIAHKLLHAHERARPRLARARGAAVLSSVRRGHRGQ